MSPTVIFDKAEHALDLINRLYEMTTEERHCDFVIKVGSERIPAHRNVLTAMSEYFDRMLFHDTIENSSGMVDVKNVDPDCVRICVDFIYGREVEVSEDKYEDLMHVANLMQLTKLAKIAENIIDQNLSVALFFAAKRIADMYGCEVLKSRCKDFANKYFLSISIEDEFVDLDKNFITEIMTSKSVKMTEGEKLEAALRWVEYDLEARSEDLVYFLKCVDLRYVSIEKRQQLVHNDPLVKDNMACVEILCSSIVNSLKLGIEKVKSNSIVLFDNISGHLWQFKPKLNSWKQMHKLHDSMEHDVYLLVIAYGDYLYAFTCDYEVFRLKYTNEAATWQQVMKNHGYFPHVLAKGNQLSAVTEDINWLPKCIDYFNPRNINWSWVEENLDGIRGLAFLVIRGCIYRFGGIDMFNNYVNIVQRFDPITSEWKKMKPMREAKARMAAVELNGKAYVIGGINGSSVASLDCYDPDIDQWTSLEPMKISRCYLRAFVIDGFIYAVGGVSNGIEEANSIEKYDVEKNEWTMVQLPSGLELGILESVDIQMD